MIVIALLPIYNI